jgi:hypothetical protein
VAHQVGARGWTGGRPNLLDVAVTRSKEWLYLVGNPSLWTLWWEAGLFAEMDGQLEDPSLAWTTDPRRDKGSTL